MAKQKDLIWRHAEDLGNCRFRCKFCGKHLAGGATRIKQHLSGIRGWGIEICEEVSEETQLEVRQVIGKPPKRAKTGATSNSVFEDESLHSSLALQRLNSKRIDNSKVYIPCAKYIITSKVLSDIIGTTIFTNFINGVSKCGPDYEPPSSSIFKLDLIPNIKKEVGEYVQNAITSSSERGYTLYYSSSLSSVFAYTSNGVVCMDSTSSKRQNKVELVLSVINRIGAKSVVQLINDPDDDFTNSILSTSFSSIFKGPCVMHDIKGMLLGMCCTPLVHNILSLVIMIDHFIWKYKINVEVPYEGGDYWGLHKLTSLSGTEKTYCWGIHKLTSLLEVESELRNLQESIETLSRERWKLMIEEKKWFKYAEYIDFLIGCALFWHHGRLIANVLQPVAEALDLVVDNGTSLGQLYEALLKVEVAGGNYYEYGYICGTDRLCGWLSSLDEQAFSNPLYAFAAFLNPIYMRRRKLKEDTRMTDAIDFVMNHVVEGGEKVIFENQVNQYRQILSETPIDEAMTKSEASGARIWWERYGSDLPVLKNHAFRILNQPCSSSFCLQNQLLGGSRDDRIVAMNIVLMERYKSLKTQMTESTVSSRQYEGEYEEKYKRCICWFEQNFSKIRYDQNYSWLMHEYIGRKDEDEDEDEDLSIFF